MAIRYDKSLNATLSSVVKRYNAKLQRLQAKGLGVDLQKITVRGLKEEFVTRADLKRELQDLERVIARGSEEMVTIGELQQPRYQYEIEKAAATRAKRNLTREIRQVERLEQNQRYPSDYLQNLRYRREFLNRPVAKLSLKQIKTRQAIISRDQNREERDRTFYDNMFNMLFRSAYQAGINQSEILPLLNDLQRLSPYELTQAVEKYKVFQNFLGDYHAFTRVEQTSEMDEGELRESIQLLRNALPSIIKDIRG